MKFTFTFFMILISIVSSDLFAQNGYVFDPTMQPIGVKIDDATQLVVSEYTLCQSMRTRIPNVRKIDRVYREVLNAKEYLIFEFHTMDNPQSLTTVTIELLMGTQGQVFAAEMGTICNGVPGCDQCKSSGGGCKCTSSGSDCAGSSSRIISPLTKVWLAKE